jgi:hypothetical protein
MNQHPEPTRRIGKPAGPRSTVALDHGVALTGGTGTVTSWTRRREETLSPGCSRTSDGLARSADADAELVLGTEAGYGQWFAERTGRRERGFPPARSMVFRIRRRVSDAEASRGGHR